MRPIKASELVENLQAVAKEPVAEMDQGTEINTEGYLACCGNVDLPQLVFEVEQAARDALFHQDGKVNNRTVRTLREAGFSVSEQRDPDEPDKNFVQITIPAAEESDDEDRTLTVESMLL